MPSVHAISNTDCGCRISINRISYYRCNSFASGSVARIGVRSRFVAQQQQKRIGGVGDTNKLFPVLSMKYGKEYGF